MAFSMQFRQVIKNKNELYQRMTFRRLHAIIIKWYRSFSFFIDFRKL